jgi:predicted transcriptional regulator
MLLGLFSAIQGALVQGLWWILIGMFVRAVAKSSYQDLQNRRLLSGETVSDVMQGDPHPVSADMTLQELVDHHVLQFRQTNFPVTDNGRLKGVIGTANLRSVDREEWPSTAVRDVMTPVEDADLISPDTSAATALQKLNQKGAEALIVARGERPLGLISREHLVQLLDLRSRFKPAG